MANLDPELIIFFNQYQPLVGTVFQGTYQGEFAMPQTQNPRDVLSVQPGTPFAVVLQGISQAVPQAYRNRIWKGITGPDDGYAEYWLWVEPCLSGVLALQSTRSFKIEECTPFPGNGVPFLYGISIKVSVVPLPDETTLPKESYKSN